MSGILLKPAFAIRGLLSDRQWPFAPFLVGLLWLVVYRLQVYHNNCFHMGDHKGPNERIKNNEPMVCTEFSKKFREIDGLCNDLSKPIMGSTDGFVGRNSNPVTNNGKDYDIMDPNPRLVSNMLFKKDVHQEAGFLNAIAAAWINFFVHDLIDHGPPRNGPNNYYVPIAEDDPMYIKEKGGKQCMVIPETDQNPEDKPGFPYRNRATHWWDSSHLYGSHKWRNQQLRSFKDGKVKWDATGNHLPLTEDKRGFVTGDRVGNVWIGVAMLHNVWMNEHNLICDYLKKSYPSWDDERLFHTARLINAATLAKVHTIEWTTATLPQESISVGMNANWHGLFKRAHAKGGMHVSPAAHGIFGSKTNHYGVDFSITEEFGAIYRLHAFVPPTIPLRTPDGKRVRDAAGKPVDLDIVDTTSDTWRPVRDYGLPAILYSFATTPPGAIGIRNHPDKMRDIVFKHLHPKPEEPTHCQSVGRVDLTVIDLLRDRERHVPRYNAFRKALHLPPARTFEEITNDAEVVRRMKLVYNNDVNKVDLLVGTLAETKWPGFGFSPTIFHLFVLMASRRIQSDRYYTNDFRAEIYTKEGMEWVATRGFQDILSEWIGKQPTNPDGADGKDFWAVNPFYLHGRVPGRPASQCMDGVANYGETGIDCGGNCARCSVGTLVKVYGKMLLNFLAILSPVAIVLLVARGGGNKKVKTH